jgi:hypothetical protein
VSDLRIREGMCLEDAKKLRPGDLAFLAAPPKRAIPGPHHLIAKRRHPSVVAGEPVVRVVPSQYLHEPAMLHGDRCMHPFPCFQAYRLQPTAQSLALGFALEYEPSVPSARTVVREAQEGEGVAAALSCRRTVAGHKANAAHLDQMPQARAQLGKPSATGPALMERGLSRSFDPTQGPQGVRNAAVSVAFSVIAPLLLAQVKLPVSIEVATGA